MKAEQLLFLHIGVAVFAVILLSVAFTFIISYIIYRKTLVRVTKETWSRDVISETVGDQVEMYRQGLEWFESVKQHVKPLTVTNDGLKLAGEYFDFGFDKAVYIIQGRAEALKYSYYFAIPYRNLGYNVLVCDGRAHGESEGKYNTAGLREHQDTLAWVRYLHDELGNKSVLLHGICVGSACALYAMTADNAPDYIEGLIAEGMYIKYKETYKQHMKALHKPTFPFCDEIMLYVSISAKRWYNSLSPIKCVQKTQKPILFIAGTQDIFSLPEKTQILYDTCVSPNKRLLWLEKGEHSKLRINNLEQYDGAIAQFVQEIHG